jgi:G3E family GTPase
MAPGIQVMGTQVMGTRVMAKTVPVTILAGPRGSGKSTILNRMLQDDPAPTAVLANASGAVAIAHRSLRPFDTGLLLGGCACCMTGGGLTHALRGLLVPARRGDIARVLVEATGLVDPAPLLAGFAEDFAVRATFHLAALAVVIDPASGLAKDGLHAWTTRQIAVADRIIVSKSDRGDAAALVATLASWGVAAPISERAHGVVAPVRPEAVAASG